MKLKFNGILTLLLALTVQFVFAQKTVSGTVSDESGPLPGVNIVIQGTKTGTETDFEGNYTLQAKQGDVLVFSYVGMETVKKSVGTENVINVILKGVNVLEEIVVVGFGRKVEPKTATYAAQRIDGDELSKTKTSNIANSLTGKAAGVQVTSSSGSVGSSSRVVVRGPSSITGNNQPLYIVDGVPIDNANIGNASDGGGVDVPTGVADIGSDDIESITVLKGPAASALYGVRAANGVIVIKTKTGKKSDKLGLTINSYLSFENPLLLPSFQNSYGQGSNNSYFYWVDGQNDEGAVDESWGPPLDIGLEFTQWNSYKVGGAPLPWVSQPNNIKDFFDTGYTINNNVSLSGASQQGDFNYRLSLGHNDQKGMVPFTEFGKIITSASASKKFDSKITANISVNYTNSYSDNLPVVGYDSENPVQQMYWSGRNVDFNALKDWRNLPLAPVGTVAEGTPINWNNYYQNNPFWALETNRNTFVKDKLIGTSSISYAFTNYLTLSGKIGTDYSTTLQTSRQAWGSNSAKHGSYKEYVRTFTETNADVLLAFDKTFKDKFSVELTAGANSMNRVQKRNFAYAPALELPNLYNLSNLKSGSLYSMTNDLYEQAIHSAYGYAKFGFNNYLFLEFTGRNDWMSILPKANNSLFYPSLTMSAVLTDMLKMKENKVLDYLKIRGGWSKVGGAGALAEYSLHPTYSLPSTGFGDVSYAFLPATLNNPNIKPETNTGIEGGIDVKMFERKLTFNVTYYDQTNNDLVLPVQISAATGYTAAFQNVGEMRNKGIEVELHSTLVKTKNNFKVDLDVNFAKNKNEVLGLGGLSSLIIGSQWSMTLEARPGLPYGSIVGSYFERDTNGNIIHQNGLPKIAPGTKVLGNVQADWTGGAGLTFGYKNFQLSTLVDAKMGGDVYSMSTTWGRYAGVLEETLLGREGGIVGDGVMSNGSGGYVTNNVIQTAENYNKAAYSNSIVESSVFDASYVKLRQVALTYTLPKKLINSAKIDGIDISFVGRNLAILYKTVPHIDPETAFSDRNADLGQEFGQQPSARSLGVNLNIKF